MSKELKTPTNWPNPEQPGMPMFPDRDCAHAIEVPGLDITDLVYYWHQNGGGWTEYNHQGSEDFLTDEDMQGWIYKGPILTPNQLADLLAGKYSIPVIQTALRVWDALDECDRTDADDMISLEQNGLMTRGIVEDANEFEDLEVGEPVWHFNAAGHALVSAIRNLGDAP